jgi:hypothetical protein
MVGGAVVCNGDSSWISGRQPGVEADILREQSTQWGETREDFSADTEKDYRPRGTNGVV